MNDKDKHNYLVNWAKENKTITKEIVDFIFDSVGGAMTLLNNNYKWGYVNSSDWEDHFGEAYLMMCEYIGDPVEDVFSLYGALSKVASRLVHSAGLTARKSKKMATEVIKQSDVMVGAGLELSEDENFDNFILKKGGGTSAMTADGQLEQEGFDLLIERMFSKDKTGVIKEVYSGKTYSVIGRERGISASLVSYYASQARKKFVKPMLLQKYYG